MAQNNSNDDFMDVMFKNVELVFPRLDQTYRFNIAENKSEACAVNVNGAAWSVGVKLTKEQAKPIYQRLKAHYEACLARTDKLQPFSTVFGMKKLDKEGIWIFEAKKRGTTDAGKVNKPPTVIDGLKRDVPKDKLDFWSGTIATVRVRAFPTTAPKTKENPKGLGGISLLLDVVQVIKPVYGGANLDDFDVYDDMDNAPASDSDPFAGAAERKASNPAMADEEF